MEGTFKKKKTSIFVYLSNEFPIIFSFLFSQNVDPTLLHPDRTIHNLYALLNSASLGRYAWYIDNETYIMRLTDRPTTDRRKEEREKM